LNLTPQELDYRGKKIGPFYTVHSNRREGSTGAQMKQVTEQKCIARWITSTYTISLPQTRSEADGFWWRRKIASLLFTRTVEKALYIEYMGILLLAIQVRYLYVVFDRAIS
jgi:hypothetical protein